MNPFTTSKIATNEILSIVNVGSYKVRTVICSFSFGWVKILGYWEKRQSRLDIINNEINNVAWVCDTIGQSILKAEVEAWVQPKKIIINPFLSNTFYYSKKIHYKQQDNEKIIDKKQLCQIISSVEKQSLSSSYRDITSKFGIEKQDLQIILTNISQIKIDGENTDSLIWKTAEDIKIEISNMLISKTNYKLIQDISNFLWKKVLKIIPEEYALTTIWAKEKKVVFLNIWNSSTFISITWNNNLKGSIRLDVWIQDLLKPIAKNTSKNRSEIIKKLDRSDLFRDEKEHFLSFFTDILTSGLKELLANNICPHHFVLSWGWANNIFIQEHIAQIDFAKYSIKMLKKVDFITASIKQIKKISWVEDILSISNINLIAQIVATSQMLSRKKDPIEQALKKCLKNLNS